MQQDEIKKKIEGVEKKVSLTIIPYLSPSKQQAIVNEAYAEAGIVNPPKLPQFSEPESSQSLFSQPESSQSPFSQPQSSQSPFSQPELFPLHGSTVGEHMAHMAKLKGTFASFLFG